MKRAAMAFWSIELCENCMYKNTIGVYKITLQRHLLDCPILDNLVPGWSHFGQRGNRGKGWAGRDGQGMEGRGRRRKKEKEKEEEEEE